MLDVHPPHTPTHTWRDFLLHIVTIVIGLLIAIGLEQTVEYLHHHHLAAEARRALSEERASNETSNDFNIFATYRHQQDLQRDLAILHAVRPHRPPPPGPFIFRHVRYLYLEDDWHKLHQSGTINYLTEPLRPMDYRYQNQDAFSSRLDSSNEDLYRAASVFRSETDKLKNTYEDSLATNAFLKRITDSHESLSEQELEKGFSLFAESTSLTTLSPVQLDSLERALQVALADDSQLLTYCFNIKRNLINNPDH
jgi:hypothetical protein